MDIFKLVGSIFVKTDDADKSIDGIQKKTSSLATNIGNKMQTAGKKIEGVGKALAPISAIAGATLGASVKSASDFTDAMAKVSTLVDTSKVSVDDLSKVFLDLSNASGKSATELAEAGYQALSASVPVEKLGQFTKTATDLAKVGFTDTSTAVDVLTTAINAYSMETEDAESIATKLVKTQNLGKTTVNELASSMGKIIPTASAMNVDIDNLTAGYVSLTKQGIATAEATTYMNSMLNELGDSGTTVGGILKEETGMSFQECMDSGMSLGDVLGVLKKHADDNGTAFNELWGSAEAGKASLAILNGGVDEFNSTVSTMKENTNELSEGLDKLNTPSAKVRKSLNQIKNSGIQLGTAFLTAVAPVLDKVSAGIEKATTWFNSLDEGTKQNIATMLLFVAGLAPVLIGIGKFIALVGSVITAIGTITSAISGVGTVLAGLGIAVNPIGLIVGAIALLAVGFVYLWNTSESFRNFWINLWNVISTTVMNIVSSVSAWLVNAWNAIRNTAVNVWNSLRSGVTNIINGLKSTITNVWNNIKSTVTNVMNNIKTSITTAWNNAKTTVTTSVNGIKTSISTALNSAKSTVTNIFNSIKSAITEKINGAKSAVTSAISAIRGAFNFTWSLPHLSLPHISISGGFSINPPSVPHFGISWYRKAMEDPWLFTKPTLFDVNPITGTAKGAGEAGNEMMYSHSKLMEDIRNASGTADLGEKIDRLIDLLMKYLPQLANMQVVMDSGTLAGELAPAIDRRLGDVSGRKDRWN
jgi:TP901 family phage tail tape measure protein